MPSMSQCRIVVALATQLNLPTGKPFYKNIVLMVFVLAIFLIGNDIKSGYILRCSGFCDDLFRGLAIFLISTTVICQ